MTKEQKESECLIFFIELFIMNTCCNRFDHPEMVVKAMINKIRNKDVDGGLWKHIPKLLSLFKLSDIELSHEFLEYFKCEFQIRELYGNLEKDFRQKGKKGLGKHETDLGVAMLAMEHWDLTLFGEHKSGKTMANREIPFVRRCIEKAEKQIITGKFAKELN